MIDEEYLNTLDESLDDLYSSDELYDYHFPVEPGWQQHRFVVWDGWEVNRWPMIQVKYETPEKEFYLKLSFKEEDYKNVTGLEINVNSDKYMSIDIDPKPLSHFFVLSDDGKLLSGSEKKCIGIINRYWNLRAFL